MMHLRYKSVTKTIKDETVEVRIFQKAETPFTVQEVKIVDLEIEWGEVDKLEPVMSSSATLTLHSDTDRRFVDLYTIDAGAIRMDVYLNNTLYWSGTLDSELYEEPFSYKDGYDVSLTFADFAILDRLKCSLSGFVSFAQIIDVCLEKSGIQYEGIHKYISTKIPNATATTIYDDTSYLSDNFYDEDGEPMTLREVLDALLKPYALQIKQKKGHIYLYDLNGLKKAFNPIEIVWDSDDATLAVDKVYNNVKVTFSPYENNELIQGEVDENTFDDLYFTTGVNIPDEKEQILGFELGVYRRAQGLNAGIGCYYFDINAVYSGSDCAGVAYTYNLLQGNQYIPKLQRPTESIGGLAFSVPKKIFIGASDKYLSSYRLRVSLDLLFDCRKNPFEAASNPNDEGAYGRMVDNVKILYVPIKLTLRDDNGRAICHYDNSAMKSDKGYQQNDAKCKWVDGEASWGNAYLCYYGNDTGKDTGVGGWSTNKQTIGYYYGKLPKSFEKLGKGEYIKTPTRSGWLELEVGTGTPYYSFMEPMLPHQSVMHEINWVMYKAPEVSLVDNYGKSIEFEDVEFTGWLNKSAKEELSIDTIIGTCEYTSLVGKGQVFRSKDKAVIGELVRGSYRNKLEKLLIGTVYSNYASRNICLLGTCEITQEFGIYTDENEPGDYIMLSERQNIHDCTSEIKIVTFKSDSYEAIDYK